VPKQVATAHQLAVVVAERQLPQAVLLGSLLPTVFASICQPAADEVPAGFLARTTCAISTSPLLPSCTSLQQQCMHGIHE
jgi:hypothetical protein